MTIQKLLFFPDARHAARKSLNYLVYLLSYRRFRKLARDSGDRFSMNWGDRYPCLEDSTGETTFDRHYVYHTAWAARILEKIKPPLHVDISSCLRFVSLVSAFIPIDYYDYRQPLIRLPGLSTKHADLLHLPFKDESIASLSCMHVIEHVGLGRYGDPLDPNGDIKAMSELKRVLVKGGNLLLAVPVGRPRIMFNAHRIYSYQQILENFTGFEPVEFALIPDNQTSEDLIVNASQEIVDSQEYGCGCFWFKKI